jgi:hypothetical protein
MLDASGFYKNLAFALTNFNGLTGATDSQILRLASKFRYADRIEVDVAWQLEFLLATSPALLLGSSLASTVASGTGPGPQRRLVPLEGVLATTDNSRLSHNLDRLSLKVPLPFGDLTVGRQVLSWGTGRFFNPTDVLSPFPPTAIDREVRRGFDAVRLAVALGEVTQLDVLWLPQQVPEENGGVVRFQTNLKGWDGSLSVGKYVRDFVFGFDLVGDLGPVAVHAEGAYTLEWLAAGEIGDRFFRGVVGADYRPHEKVVVTAEYSYNGYGSRDAARYAQILSSPRALRGELFGAGMHVVALAANLKANDLLNASLSVLCNVTDPSALAFAALEYSFTQSVLIRAGAYVPMGRPPDPALATTPSRGLRSEYGSYPFGAFLQVGLYVP